MSADDYANMTTERLFDLFVELAKAVGGIYLNLRILSSTRLPDKVWPTPERKARVAALKAIAATLSPRKPIAQVRRLMEDDDPDVSAWAAGQFFAIDPALATATLKRLMNGEPDPETLALVARARKAPPSQPTLKDMSDDALLARFEDAATRLDAVKFLDCVEAPKDQGTKNRLIREGTGILREVKSRGLLERLLPLLASANDTVRFRAAQGCLRVAEAQAVATLEAIAAKNNFDDSIFAKDALYNWRNGKTLIDGL